MDNIADLIIEVLLAEGFGLEQIEEFIESEEFDAFTDVLLEEIAKEDTETIEEGKSRLVRLGKAIGDELGIRKPRPDEKIWGATRGKNFRNTAGHMAVQATMGGAAGAAWYGSGKAAAVGAGLATAGGLALQVKDRYKYLKNIGEGAEVSHWNKSRSDREKTVKDRLEDKKAKAKKAKENGDWPAFKAYRKGDNLKETIEESLKVGDKVKALKGPHKGETQELLMEIKMKLKPGQKMTPKQFAKMKAEVLAKQKEDKAKKEAKKAAPKEEKKDEKVDTDDTNRNARILKGQFPWGNVSQTLANSALAKLKQIPKPEDRLNAMDAIWDHSKHFHDLIRNGKVDYKKEKEKGKITLPKVKGVTE